MADRSPEVADGRHPTSLVGPRRPGGVGGLVARAGFPWRAPAWPTGLERPVPRTLGVDYDTAWARHYGVRVARAVALDNLARPALHLLARPTVTGLDRLQGLGAPLIFVANHASHLDTPLVLITLPPRLRHRTVVAAGADFFFDRTWKAHLWAGLISAIPVERRRVSRRSMELAAALLEDGWNLAIFPEGGRSPDGWAQPFRGGAAYLARRTGLPVVPIHLGGTGRVHGKVRPGFHPGRTTVTIGPALRAGEGEDARNLANRIEAAVAALADEATSDWWSARRRAAAGTTPPLTGPEAGSWRRAWALGPDRRRSRDQPTWPL
ncbi:MAG TPA: lysophospholipid acyltransferase family protein [Acidimicrobiales bacterium]|nr:lysophospholipid acyltransferase family protein [Acidimicrobiales bacterium]